MKKILVLCMAAVLLIMLAGCKPRYDNTKPTVPNDPEEVLEVAMEALTKGSELPVFLGADGTPVTISQGSGLAGAITSKVSYQVLSFTPEGQSATAELEITAPDAVQLVHAALEGMETYDEEAFTAKLEELLGNAKTKTFSVKVQLTQVDGQWLFVFNEEMSNAITGGLADEYVQIRQSIMDAFAKGGEEE